MKCGQLRDRLTGGGTRHWTGAHQGLTGIARIDGKNFRFLGGDHGSIPALEESSRKITPTRTIVNLQSPAIELQLCFLTPAFPDDLRILSRPVTYLTWTVRSRDSAPHDVTLYLDADAAVSTDTRDQPVVWSRDHVPGLNLLRVGTQDQRILRKQCRCEVQRAAHGRWLRISSQQSLIQPPDWASLRLGKFENMRRFGYALTQRPDESRMRANLQ